MTALFLLGIPTKVAVVLTALALIWKGEIRPTLARWFTAWAAAAVICLIYVVFGIIGDDYFIFRNAGCDVLAGRDPYAASRFAVQPFLNPPTALPLFALFALLPETFGFATWTTLNILGCLALPAYAQAVLRAQEGLDNPMAHGSSPPWALPPSALAVLAGVLVSSDASLTGLFLGQLSILTALALLAALDAQGRGRPILAGVWLSLATIKVSTTLPFLLLFHRRADLRTWIALGVVSLGLCVMTGDATGLPGRLMTMAHRIGVLSSPGKVNDYSFQNIQSGTILGFDHALYRLGLRDRQLIRLGQLLAILGSGIWVFRAVIGGLPRAAACSLVALFSTLFLYHRIYDTVVLALPLVYCVGRTRVASGRARWFFAMSALSILLVIHFDVYTIPRIAKSSLGWGIPGRVLQAAVLPYATWFVLLAMACLALGHSYASRTSSPPVSG